MKNARILALFAALLMLLVLFGCSKAENSVQNVSRPGQDILHLEQKRENEADIVNIELSLQPLVLTPSSGNPNSFESSGENLFVVDVKPNGADVLLYDADAQLVSKVELAYPETNHTNETAGFSYLSVCGETIWGISYVMEMNIGGDQMSDVKRTQWLTRFDQNGSVSVQIELGEDLAVLDLQAADDGCILLTENAIIHYTPDGTSDWTIESKTYFSRLLRDPSGKFYCASAYDNGFVYPVDENGHSLGEPVVENCGSMDFLYCRDGILVGCSETTLYQYNLSDGQPIGKTNLSALGVTAISDCAPYQGGIAIVYHSMLGGKGLGILQTGTETNDTPDELTIGTIAGQNIYFLNAVIEQFRLREPSCKLNIVEYANIDSFSTAITTGNAPDLICLQNLPAEEYAHRGLLENLYNYIDASRLNPAYRKFERGGQLFAFTPDFTLDILFRNPEIVPDDCSSFEDLAQIVCDSEVHRSDPQFAYLMVAYAMNRFIDLEDGTCNFDSQEFLALLQMCAPTAPVNADEGTLPAIWPIEITDISMYAQIIDLGMKPLGTTILRPTSNLIGIFSGSRQKDRAGELIQFAQSEEVQNAVIRNAESFPVLDSALHQMLDPDDPYAASLLESLQTVQNAEISSNDLYSIILEELDVFMNGAQSKEMTAEHIQSRVSIYLAEKQ